MLNNSHSSQSVAIYLWNGNGLHSHKNDLGSCKATRETR